MTTVVDALAALARGDWATAAPTAAQAAAERPDSQLAEALAQFLTDMPAPGVYDEPSAFETFIDNAGNVELYRRTIQALSELHTTVMPGAVLDIGCGDGRVTAGALTAATTRIELVEPSAELLGRAVAALEKPDIEKASVSIEPTPRSSPTSSCRCSSVSSIRRWPVTPSSNRSTLGSNSSAAPASPIPLVG